MSPKRKGSARVLLWFLGAATEHPAATVLDLNGHLFLKIARVVGSVGKISAFCDHKLGLLRFWPFFPPKLTQLSILPV